MKKVFLCILIVLTLFTGVACNNNEPTTNQGKSGVQDSEETNKVEEEKLKEKEDDVKTFKIGDTIVTDTSEITINNIEFSYDVLPDNVSGMYTHYAAESGKVYIHIDTDVKNIQKQNLPVDKIMKVKVDYNNGYEYRGAPIPEDKTLGFTYANITDIDPLETLGVRFLVNCPQEVEESENPVVLFFDINGEQYRYDMR